MKHGDSDTLSFSSPMRSCLYCTLYHFSIRSVLPSNILLAWYALILNLYIKKILSVNEMIDDGRGSVRIESIENLRHEIGAELLGKVL